MQPQTPWTGYVHNGPSLKRRVAIDVRTLDDGGLCAAVFECIGEDAERNANVLTQRFVPLLTLVPPDFSGDPRRAVRHAWNEVRCDLGLDALVPRNAVSFAAVTVRGEMLAVARRGHVSVSSAGPRGFRTILHPFHATITAVNVVRGVHDRMLVLGSDLFWQGADWYVYPRQCLRLDSLQERCDYLRQRLLSNGLSVRSHAAVLIDLSPLRS